MNLNENEASNHDAQVNIPPLRDEQVQIQQWIEDKKEDTKLFLIEAPTGTGKSFIPFITPSLGGAKRWIITKSFNLTNQYLREWPHLVEIKGRGNFVCKRYLANKMLKDIGPHPYQYGVSVFTCESCVVRQSLSTKRKTKLPSFCAYIKSCYYNEQKRKGFENPIAIMNFSMFIALMKNNPKPFYNSILFVDEADLLVDMIIDTMSMTESLVPKCLKTVDEGFKHPYNTKVDKDDQRLELKKILSFNSTVVESDFDDYYKKQAFYIHSRAKDVNHEEYLLDILENRINFAVKAFEQQQIVPVIDKKEEEDTSKVKFVCVDDSNKVKKLEKMLSVFKHVVMYSATTNPKLKEMVDENQFLRVPSTFPLEIRQVHKFSNMRLNSANFEEKIKDIGMEILYLLQEKKGKALIHFSSFKQCEQVANLLKQPGISKYHQHTIRCQSSSKDNIIELVDEHKNDTNQNCVLISPNIGVGNDFPDETARLNIIGKIPYPPITLTVYLKGLYDKNYYNDITLSRLQQTLGRGVRHKNDYCYNVVLDKLPYVCSNHEKMLERYPTLSEILGLGLLDGGLSRPTVY